MVVTLDSLRDSSVYKERAMRAVKAQRSVVAMGDAQGAWGSGGASGAAGVAQCAMFKETLIVIKISVLYGTVPYIHGPRGHAEYHHGFEHCI